MAASILRQSGYRTALYTSPHLVDFRERMQVDGEMIPCQDVLRLGEEIRSYNEKMMERSKDKRMTFFELTTAMAFTHFAEMGAEEAVIEVGMGGRLDATNVIKPDACAISVISLEHTQYLGHTIAAIAGEKAGIIKSGVPVVTIDQSEEALNVFRQKAAEMRADLKVIGKDSGFRLRSSTIDGNDIYLDDIGREVHVPLIGTYQASNAALSVGLICELMKRGIYIPDEAIDAGLSKVKWPGRMEIISRDPTMIFDATHTPESALIVASDIERLFGRKVILIMGVLNDKDLTGLTKAFGQIARDAIAVSPRTTRAFKASEVAASLSEYCPTEIIDDVGSAMDRALRTASKDDIVLVTGSLFTLGEAMRWWDGQKTN